MSILAPSSSSLSSPSSCESLQKRLQLLSTLPWFTQWPIDVIRIVTDYISIRLLLTFESDPNLPHQVIKILNWNLWQVEVAKLSFEQQQHQQEDRTNHHRLARSNLDDRKGVIDITSVWCTWGPSSLLKFRLNATYAVIDQILVSLP
jgi:hypothetical protein